MWQAPRRSRNRSGATATATARTITSCRRMPPGMCRRTTPRSARAPSRRRPAPAYRGDRLVRRSRARAQQRGRSCRRRSPMTRQRFAVRRLTSNEQRKANERTHTGPNDGLTLVGVRLASGAAAARRAGGDGWGGDGALARGACRCRHGPIRRRRRRSRRGRGRGGGERDGSCGGAA